jgi:hypothetical protein
MTENPENLESLISEINDLWKVHCDQIAHEYHKHRDGVWSIHFDMLMRHVIVEHQGYLWDFSVTMHPRNLAKALVRFRDALDKRIKSHVKDEGDDD